MPETPDSMKSSVVQKQTLTRTRYHYRPISSSEFLLTLVLTVFVGVGIFVASTVNERQNNTGSQVQLTATKINC